MYDPDREWLDREIAALPYAGELDDFDREEAIYWFASDWHGGQDSNLYSVLSTSMFKPGPMSGACEPDSVAQMVYDDLVRIFGEAGDVAL